MKTAAAIFFVFVAVIVYDIHPFWSLVAGMVSCLAMSKVDSRDENQFWAVMFCLIVFGGGFLFLLGVLQSM
jgi:hypothetical protein